MGMSLDELVNSHKAGEGKTETRPSNPVVVSPVTGESLGYCRVCGVVSFCLKGDECPVCAKRTAESVGVEVIKRAIAALQETSSWVESLGPQSSWNVEENREPLHVKHTSVALLRTLQGILDRETGSHE